VKIAARRAQPVGASITSSVLNLANTNMGVGMLALPSAMASAGVLGGICLLLLSATIATFGSHLLTECVDVVRRPASLSRVTERALGTVGIILTDLSVIIIGTSCAIGYLIVVGDMLPEIKHWLVGGTGDSILDARQFWILCALPVIAPLAFLRRLDSLRLASTFVVIGVGVIVVTVLVFLAAPLPLFDPCADDAPSPDPTAHEYAYDEHNIHDRSAGEHTAGVQANGDHDGERGSASEVEEGSETAECRGSFVGFRDAQHTLSALPTFLFAFAAQINVPSIASELAHPTPSRVWAVLLGGIGLTVTTYLVVAAGGYATYGDRVTGDLLVSYPQAAVLARVSLVFVVLLSHPVVSFPVTPCVLNSTTLISKILRRQIRQTLSRRTSPRLSSLSITPSNATATATDDVTDAPPSPPPPFDDDFVLGSAQPLPPPYPPPLPPPYPPPPPLPPPPFLTSHLSQASSLFVSERASVISISLYLLATTTTALFVSDLGIVVSLAGAVAATMVIFMAPGACYYKLHGAEPRSTKCTLAGVLCGVGLLLLPALVLLVLASKGCLGPAWSVAT